MTEEARLILSADTRGMRQAETALNRVTRAGAGTERQIRQTGRSMGSARAQAQQFGYQIQDIAVGLQGGQSPFVVLSQQGSQLASLMGPQGALIGAMIAVGGAIAGALIPSLFAAKKSTADLVDEIDKLTDGFKKATAAQKDHIRVLKAEETLEFQKKIKGIKEEITDYEEKIRKTEKALAKLNKTSAIDALPTYYPNQEAQLFTDNIEKQRKALSKAKLETQLENQRKALLALNSERDTEIQKMGEIDVLLDKVSGKYYKDEEAKKAAIKAAQDLRKQLDSERSAEEAARKQAIATIDRYSLSVLTGEQRIIASYERQKDAVRQAMQDNAAVHEQGAQLIIDIEERKQAELQRMRDREAQRRKNQQQADINQAAGYFGQLSGLMSSESKEAFRIGKAAAMANATIKGVQSAINAYEFGSRIGGPVAGAAFAAVSAAFTGAQIAQIESQSPPRAQGGQMLPNQSYRVGEFGPEIVTTGGSGGFVTQPQEGGGVSIQVNNINNAPGVKTDATVRQVDDRKFVIDVVAQEISNSRSTIRRGLHSTSNVEARGI